MRTRNRPARLDPRTLPTIAQRMKLLRLATGLSATDFARENGMGRAMWHNIEVGFSRIGIDAAMSLCDKYQITLDWIYRGHDARLPRSLTKRLQEVAEAEPEGDA